MADKITIKATLHLGVMLLFSTDAYEVFGFEEPVNDEMVQALFAAAKGWS